VRAGVKRVGLSMRKLLFTVLSISVFYGACASAALAGHCHARRHHYVRVDEPGLPAHRHEWVRAGGDCGRHLCALDTSVFSLYGSYGPDGGQSYWGAYTSAGWGY
jgi:hypothetical protein